MTENLEKEITDIVETLKKSNRHHLAKCIEDNWNKTALVYSTELNFWNPQKPMEVEMLAAFEKELERLGVNEESKEKIIASINKRRILQTAPHLVATENPRMLTINWLGSLGVPDDEFYVVSMFSGIPFSNNFRPGRINMKDNSVNLFPTSMQDDLVYRSKIPEKLVETVKSVPWSIKVLLPEARIGESYTKWALQSCTNIERKILKRENLIYMDINEVMANYLVNIKNKKDHPLNKLEELQKVFPEESFFYKDSSCPGLLLTFIALSFLNDFKCFGSFSQVEYLPEYQKKLGELSFMKEFGVEKVPTANLTTGVFPENAYPADIIMNGGFKADPNILFGELLIPMKDKLK